MKGQAKSASLERPPMDWLVERRYVSRGQADHGNRGWYYARMRYDEADAALRYAYEQNVGHEPPKPRHAAMSTQYEYGLRKCRTNVMKAAILSAAMDNSHELVAA